MRESQYQCNIAGIRLSLRDQAHLRRCRQVAFKAVEDGVYDENTPECLFVPICATLLVSDQTANTHAKQARATKLRKIYDAKGCRLICTLNVLNPDDCRPVQAVDLDERDVHYHPSDING